MSARQRGESASVDVGVVLSPALEQRLPGGSSLETLVDGLRQRLSSRIPYARWNIVGRVDDSTEDLAPRGERLPATRLMTAGRAVLLAGDLDIVVWLTDQPLELHDRPVLAQSSPVQHVVVNSVADTRDISAVLDEVTDLTLELFDLGGGSSDADVLDVLTRVTSRPPVRPIARVVWTVRHVAQSSRLFVREVRATRPWLMARHLTRALVGAAAAAGIAVVTPDFWTLADRMNPFRLGVVTALALAAAVGVIVIGGGLRERGRSGGVALHNAAVWTAVMFGVAALYATLFVTSLAVTLVVLPWGLVSQTVGHSAGWGTLVKVGALTGAAALTGSIFGAGLEDDESLREAAFGGSDDVRYADQNPGADPDADPGAVPGS